MSKYLGIESLPSKPELMSDRLESVMRILTQSCPDYVVGDFVTPRPKCCVYHNAAATVKAAQELLRGIKQ